MSIIPPVKMSAKEEAKILEELLTGTNQNPDDSSDGRRTITDRGTYFLFNSLQLSPGRYTDVALYKSLLGNGKRTQDQHFEYTKAQNNRIFLPSGIVLYQMMHTIYSLRNKKESQGVVSAVRELMKQDWETNYPHTGTRMKYQPNTTQTTIVHQSLDGTNSKSSIAVPEYTKADSNWSYLTLAKEQPESSLGKTQTLTKDKVNVLEAILGPNASEAGAIFQYACSRKNGNLREIRLWTPTLTNRASERALVLGVSDDDSMFIVDADDDVNVRPARGVAVAQKK